jgi:thiamine monophosphate synthase
MPPSPRLQPPRLYAILDPEQMKDRATETVLRELLEGGTKLLQLRAKAMIPVDFLRLACARGSRVPMAAG